MSAIEVVLAALTTRAAGKPSSASTNVGALAHDANAPDEQARDTVADVVLGKLSAAPAIQKLQAEVAITGQISEQTRLHIADALVAAAQEDAIFAATLTAAIDAAQQDPDRRPAPDHTTVHGSATAHGTGSVAVGAAGRDITVTTPTTNTHTSNTLHVGGSSSGNIVQARTIEQLIVTSPPPRDHRSEGMLALSRNDYSTAITALQHAATAEPGAHFYLALALLKGRRPHSVRSSSELNQIRYSLSQIENLPHGRLLSLLTEEDRVVRRQPRGEVPGHVTALAGTADPTQIRHILAHVTAPGNRVWELLRHHNESSQP